MANRNPDIGSAAQTTTRPLADWETEDSYWRDNWQSRPYVTADRGYEFYRPAYRYGVESASLYSGRRFEDLESDLRSGWERLEGTTQSTWEGVKDAVRDAWDRVTNR